MFSATTCHSIRRVRRCAQVYHSVFKTFIFSHYYVVWTNMIQIKSIAMLMIAIAIVGAIGTAGLLVQHANANQCGNGAVVPCPSPGQGADVLKGNNAPGSIFCTFPSGTSSEDHKVFTLSNNPTGPNAHVNCHT